MMNHAYDDLDFSGIPELPASALEPEAISLFLEADRTWICPITHTKFDRSDVAAIEQHKRNIINMQEEAAKQNMLRVKIAHSGALVTTLAELCSWLTQSAKLVSGLVVDPDSINIQPLVSKRDHNYQISRTSMVVNCSDFTKLTADQLATMGLKTRNQNIVLTPPVSEFSKKYFDLANDKAKYATGGAHLVRLQAKPGFLDNLAAIRATNEEIAKLQAQVERLVAESDEMIYQCTVELFSSHLDQM